MPRSLAALGLVAAAADLLSSVFIVPIARGEPVALLIEMATIASLLWFLCTGVYMAVRGGSAGHDAATTGTAS